MDYAEERKLKALKRLSEKGISEPDFSELTIPQQKVEVMRPEVELKKDLEAVDKLQVLRTLRDKMPEEAYRDMFDNLSKQLYKENRFKKLIQE